MSSLSLTRLLAGVFVVGGAAVPVQAQSLHVSGPPVPVLPVGYAHATPSPDGAYLAFTTPSYHGLWVREEATGRVRLLSDEPAVGFAAAWSPDGRALATRPARFDAAGGRADAVVVLGVDGTRDVLVDFGSGVSATPRWSPDGANVLLARSGGAVEALPSGRTAVAEPLAAPRGAAALSVGADATLASATSVPAALPSDVPVLAAVASPSGDRTVVHLMGRGLWLVTAGGDVRSLGEGEAPAWSPDGRYLAFTVTADDGYAITSADLHVVRADGSDRRVLSPTPDVVELNPAWTADGRALLYDDLAAGRVMRLPLTERR